MKRTLSTPHRNLGLSRSFPFLFPVLGLLITVLTFTACKKFELPPLPKEANRIKHVVVIYLENHSFDNLYGQFPGANGLSNASAANITQVDASGTPYSFLPSIPMSNAFPLN